MSQRTTRQNSVTVESPSESFPDLRALLVESNKQVLQSISSLKDDIGELRSTFSSLEKRIGGIEIALTSFRESQAKCQEEVDSIKKEIEFLKASEKKSSLQSRENSILREVEDREERRDNIMVFGVTEKINGSIDERKKHDLISLREIFGELGSSDVEPSAVRRVGSVNNHKARPLKVKLDDRSEKAELLKKARSLRDSSVYKNVYLTNDLTKFQQKERLRLRQELKDRREAGEDVVIYNNEIRERSTLRNFQA